MLFFAWALLIPLLCFTCSEVHSASFYLDVNYLNYNTSHFWNKKGERKPTYNRFNENQVNACLAYEFNSCDLISTYASYDMIQQSLNGRSCGFSDIEVCWVHDWHRSSLGFFSTQIIGIIPSGKEKFCLRYGRFGIEGSLLYTIPFQLFKRPGWASASLGYRVYSGFPSDQLRTDFGFLYEIKPWCLLHGYSRLDYGVFNGKRNEPFNTVLFNPNYRLFKVRIEVLAFLTNSLYLNGGFFQHVWGENVGTGTGWFGGINFAF
jgi:hypothetical protein